MGVRRLLLLLPLLLLVLAPAAGAGVLVVGPPGSGAPYESIHAAVAAAAPGDTVYVLSGSYLAHSPIVLEKPLALVGAGSDVTSYTAAALAPGIAPLPLLVRGLGPGEEVRVAGLRLFSTGWSGLGSTGIVVEDCLGPVVLAGLRFAGSSQQSGGVGAVQVRGSVQVSLDRCDLDAGPSGPGAGPGAQPAILVESSTVAVNDCTVAGGRGGDGSWDGTAGHGAPAVRADSSTVHVSRSELRGGDGGDGTPAFPVARPGDGGPAILSVSSTVLGRGGAGALAQGGAGGAGTFGGGPVEGAGAPAAVLDAASLLSATSDLPLVPGADGGGAVTAPDVDPGGGTYLPLPGRLASLAAEPKVAHGGGALTLSAGGEAGATAFPFLSLGQAAAFELPGVPGPVVLDPGGLAALPAFALGAAGEASVAVPVPAAPALEAATVLLQALVLSPSGDLSVSLPVLAAVAKPGP